MILISLLSNSKLTLSPRGFATINNEPVSPSGVTWGVAATEPEGVEGRRIALSHAYSADDIAFAEAAGFTVVETLPGDWRHQETE